MGNQANFQVNGTPSYGDFPFTNYGVTDIPAGVAVIVDTGNLLSGTNDGIGIALPGADGVASVGVTMEIVKAGQPGRVRTAGIAAMTADGAITAGGVVMTTNDVNKVGFAKAQTSAKAQLGYALNTVADGETVLVLLALANNA